MPLTGPRMHTLKRVSQFRSIIKAQAEAHTLDPFIVAGVIAQESRGNPYAIRPEPGFWRRYGRAMKAFAARTTDRRDDHWMRYPDIAAASYGLMQVMYQVALERGLRLEYPTELCDPETGIRAGCRQLAWCLQRRGGDLDAALLRYNGGGNPGYPGRVLRWSADARVSGLF